MYNCKLCDGEMKFDNFRTKDAEIICSDCVHELNVRDEEFEEKQLTDFTLDELKQIMNNTRNTEKYEKKYRSKFNDSIAGIIMFPVVYFILILLQAYFKYDKIHYRDVFDLLKQTFTYSFPVVIVYICYTIFFLYKLRKVNRKDL